MFKSSPRGLRSSMFGMMFCLGLAGSVSAQPFVYVTQGEVGNDSVAIIDAETQTLVNTIAVGNGASDLTSNPDSTRVYVTNTNDGTVSVIDTVTQTVLDTLDVGGSPRSIGMSPSGHRVYIGDSSTGVLSSRVPETMALVQSVQLGPGDLGIGPQIVITVSPSGDTIYVGTDFPDVGMHVIDAVTFERTHQIIPFATFRVSGLDLSPDGGIIYLSGISPTYAIDTTTFEATELIEDLDASIHNGQAFDSLNDRLYVAMSHVDGRIKVVDTLNQIELAPIPMASPQGMALTPTRDFLYVASSGTGSVNIVDTGLGSVVNTVSVGGGPGRVLIPLANPNPPAPPIQTTVLDVPSLGFEGLVLLSLLISVGGVLLLRSKNRKQLTLPNVPRNVGGG